MNDSIEITYQKISSKEQLLEIVPGTILIKYPALGLPENKIDLSDDTRYLAYEVYKISNSEIQLRIPLSEIAPSIQDISVPHMNGRSTEASVLVKEFDVLLREKLWWISKEIPGSATNNQVS
jgi:hypothetical protein